MADAVRARLYASLKDSGIAARVRAELRYQLVCRLQQQVGGDGAGTALVPPAQSSARSLRTATIDSMVVQYLQAQGYKYAASVLIPECGDDGRFLDLPLDDVLRALGLSQVPRVARLAHASAASEPLSRLVDALAALGDAVLVDQGTQTLADEAAYARAAALEHRLAEIEAQFPDAGRNDASLEERMSRFQREVEARARDQVTRETARFRDLELARMRIEEAGKYREQLAAHRRSLDAQHEERMQQLASREDELRREADSRAAMLEQTNHAQRAELLAELERLRAREQEVRRDLQARERAMAVQETQVREREARVEQAARDNAHALRSVEARAHELFVQYREDWDKQHDAERRLVQQQAAEAAAARSIGESHAQEVARCKDEAAVLRKRLDDEIHERAAASASVAVLQQDLAEARRELQQLHASQADLTAQLATHESRAEADAAHASVNESQVAVAERSLIASEFEAALAALRAELERATAAKDGVSRELEQSTARAADLSEQVTSLSQALAQTRSELRRAEAAGDEARRDLARTQAQLEGLKLAQRESAFLASASTVHATPAAMPSAWTASGTPDTQEQSGRGKVEAAARTDVVADAIERDTEAWHWRQEVAEMHRRLEQLDREDVSVQEATMAYFRKVGRSDRLGSVASQHHPLPTTLAFVDPPVSAPERTRASRSPTPAAAAAGAAAGAAGASSTGMPTPLAVGGLDPTLRQYVGASSPMPAALGALMHPSLAHPSLSASDADVDRVTSASQGMSVTRKWQFEEQYSPAQSAAGRIGSASMQAALLSGEDSLRSPILTGVATSTASAPAAVGASAAAAPASVDNSPSTPPPPPKPVRASRNRGVAAAASSVSGATGPGSIIPGSPLMPTGGGIVPASPMMKPSPMLKPSPVVPVAEPGARPSKIAPSPLIQPSAETSAFDAAPRRQLIVAPAPVDVPDMPVVVADMAVADGEAAHGAGSAQSRNTSLTSAASSAGSSSAAQPTLLAAFHSPSSRRASASDLVGLSSVKVPSEVRSGSVTSSSPPLAAPAANALGQAAGPVVLPVDQDIDVEVPSGSESESTAVATRRGSSSDADDDDSW